LLKGGLKRLAMGRDGIAPVGLVDQFYGPLVEFLARSHQVEVFPYDWRHSVRKAAARLANTLEPLVTQAERDGQPVRLVAHSMGGLVVRAMIADGGAGGALWQRIIRLPGSRFLMLGTPNLGSYEAVRWLTGCNPTQSKLALLDITQSTDQIIGLVARYPGLLELLPFAPDDPDFADAGRWQKLRQETAAAWPTAEPAVLQEAAATWKLLRAAPPDPRHMVYVAGCQPATVIDYQLSAGNDWWPPERKRLEFIATRDGDGTVSWQSGRLAGVPTWYVEDTAHDALCAQPKAFPGYLNLLVNGQTALLPPTPPARTRAASAAERFVLPPAPPTDSIPAAVDIAGFGFSGSGPLAAETETRPAPTIEVAIRHGSLAYARHPVVVGHYQGDTVVSAEAALDQQLGGALTRRVDLGIYPGPLGTHAVVLNESAQARPAGAIVVGLGQVGGLSPGQLEESLRVALLDFALDVVRWPDQRFGDDGRPRSAAVTCLLVGTGAGGLPVGDALEAILRAAVAANRRLAEQELDGRVLIDRLEFVELYEDVAILAADALTRILQNAALAAAVRWPAGAVETGQAGRRRVRFAEAPEWYQRLEIIEEADAGRLRFVFTTDRARAEETWPPGNSPWSTASCASPAATPDRTRKSPKPCSKCCCRCACANSRRSRATWSSWSTGARRAIRGNCWKTAGPPANGRRRWPPAASASSAPSTSGSGRCTASATRRWSSATPTSPARRISPTCPGRARRRGRSPSNSPPPATTSMTVSTSRQRRSWRPCTRTAGASSTSPATASTNSRAAAGPARAGFPAW
jgi:hypothetical protein